MILNYGKQIRIKSTAPHKKRGVKRTSFKEGKDGYDETLDLMKSNPPPKMDDVIVLMEETKKENKEHAPC